MNRTRQRGSKWNLIIVEVPRLFSPARRWARAAIASLVSILMLFTMPVFSAARNERQVIEALDRVTDAGLRRDVDVMQSLYSDRYFHTNPDGSVMDRAAVLASYRAPSAFTFSASRRTEQRVELFGDCAIVNAAITLEGARNGAPFTSRYRVTYVFVRVRRGWHVANSHATLLGIDPAPVEWH